MFFPGYQQETTMVPAARPFTFATRATFNSWTNCVIFIFLKDNNLIFFSINTTTTAGQTFVIDQQNYDSVVMSRVRHIRFLLLNASVL